MPAKRLCKAIGAHKGRIWPLIGPRDLIGHLEYAAGHVNIYAEAFFNLSGKTRGVLTFVVDDPPLRE
jgi:hypothetical protein